MNIKDLNYNGIKKKYHLSKETIDHFNIEIDATLEKLSFNNLKDVIFNKEVLKDKKENDVIFVVSNELDVATLHEIKVNAISLKDKSNNSISHLIATMKKLKDRPILLLDSAFINKDDVKIVDILTNNNIKIAFVKNTIGFWENDLNSFFILEKEDFLKEIEKNKKDYEVYIDKDKQKEFLEEYKDNSYYKNEFVESQNNSKKEYIATGFNELDRLLNGGLQNQRLYILGAGTGRGKTTFVLQIADYIASNGQDVLFFALEMSRLELIAKSISRLTYTIDSNHAIYANSFDMRFNNFEYNEVYEKAKSQYFNTKGLTIIEASGEIGALQVRQIVGDYINYKQKKPVVIVDYLQILAPYSKEYVRDIRLNIDKTILELKRIARDYKIPVITVSSFNRMGAKEKAAEDAFKESGAIEYSCDVLLGLHKRDDTKHTDIKHPIREMELVILKNRIGQANKEINYNYNAGFHHFEEVEKTNRQAI